jgi:HK97 family phage portal protein
MGFLSRVVAEQKGASTFWEQLVKLLDGGAKSKAGPSVNLQAAFRVSAALACMRAISQGCAQVPFKLMRDYEEAGLARKRAARDHVLYDLVTAKPNSWQSAFEFRETQALHACMGNSYAYKGKYRGKVAELILLDPARVKPVQHADWSITYKVTGRDGVTEELAPDQIWHVRGPSWDGFMGLETLSMAREAMGLSIALEQSQANLHANGVRPTGVYSVDGSLDERQYDKLNAWIKKEAAAGGGGTLILDRGAKWLSQTMTGVDAQHKEIRDQQVEEVCRFFGILPTVIGFTGDKANTYASAEAMFAAHRVQTLAPWWTRIQESADINLLRDDERKQGYYFKHIASGLLLATAKDQGEVFAKALGSGGSPAWMTQDEVRELLELDPFGGEAAKLPPRVAAPARAPAPANP